MLSGDPGEAFIQGTEGSAIQRPLCADAERAETSGTNPVGNLLQEIGSLGGVGTCVGKVADVQFSRGEIDQNQHALPAPNRAGIVGCCG